MISFNLLNKPIRTSPSGKIYAGASKINITPLPGQPMGGFGNDIGKISRGFWTHLYSNSTYIEDKMGNYMIIVACDLWSFPQGLGDYVVEQLQNDQNPLFHVARENIIFSATHTHHSPGNFSTSFGYNEGSAAEPGFDEAMFAFLGDRIAYSIKQSIVNKKEATISFAQSNLLGITRNRSVEAFQNNPAHLRQVFYDRIANPDQYYNAAVDCLSKPDEVFQAVDPTLSSIVVRRLSDSSLIAIINNFSSHPTIMGPDNMLHSSDFFGTAKLYIENHIKGLGIQNNKVPIVSFLNGASGDTSPNWVKQNRNETIRIGKKLAEAVIQNLNNSEVLNPVKIECRLEFSDIRGQDISNRNWTTCTSSDLSYKTSTVPVVGKSVLAGAEDGRVVKNIDSEYIVDGHVNECTFSESLVDSLSCHETQGVKKQHSISKLAKFSAPKFLPLGVYQLGSIKLLTLPGEITALLGHRIKSGVQVSPTGPTPIIVGLANEYISYFTTPHEYELQHYEGGFTVYGKGAGLFLEQEIKRINTYGSPTVRYFNKKKYRTGPTTLNKKKILEAANEDWGIIALDSLYNIDKKAVANWSQSTNLFQYNKGNLYSYIPEFSIQIFKDSLWQELIIQENINITDGAVYVPQNTIECPNIISYVQPCGDGKFCWETIWMKPQSYNSDLPHRMIRGKNSHITEYQLIN